MHYPGFGWVDDKTMWELVHGRRMPTEARMGDEVERAARPGSAAIDPPTTRLTTLVLAR